MKQKCNFFSVDAHRHVKKGLSTDTDRKKQQALFGML